MKLSVRLRGLIDARRQLNHPFYLAWSEGKLSQEVLQKYAAQYYAQVDSFPRFISAVHSMCPNIQVRKVLLSNLVDEELRGMDHPALWMKFAVAMGNSESAVRTEKIFPETQALVDTYFDLAFRDWRDGLCALYAYEVQVPEVSKSKKEGLNSFYGVDSPSAVEFFTAHIKYDVEHAASVAALIDAHAEPAKAERATIKAADALNHFLDGMCRFAGIPTQSVAVA